MRKASAVPGGRDLRCVAPILVVALIGIGAAACGSHGGATGVLSHHLAQDPARHHRVAPAFIRVGEKTASTPAALAPR